MKSSSKSSSSSNTKTKTLEDTELHDEVKKNNLIVVKHLVENGAHINALNKGEWTPLHLASGFGLKNIASYLIEKGAKINKKGWNQWTPLHNASGFGHEHMVSYLIENGKITNPIYK